MESIAIFELVILHKTWNFLFYSYINLSLYIFSHCVCTHSMLVSQNLNLELAHFITEWNIKMHLD